MPRLRGAAPWTPGPPPRRSSSRPTRTRRCPRWRRPFPTAPTTSTCTCGSCGAGRSGPPRGRPPHPGPAGVETHRPRPGAQLPDQAGRRRAARHRTRQAAASGTRCRFRGSVSKSAGSWATGEQNPGLVSNHLGCNAPSEGCPATSGGVLDAIEKPVVGVHGNPGVQAQAASYPGMVAADDAPSADQDEAGHAGVDVDVPESLRPAGPCVPCSGSRRCSAATTGPDAGRGGLPSAIRRPRTTGGPGGSQAR